MPKLCVNCCHYQEKSPYHPFGSGRCAQPDVGRKINKLFRGAAAFDTIDFAREICDPQDKGHFIYFEPGDPASRLPLVRLTREYGTPSVTT